jgi:hypothetical protein
MNKATQTEPTYPKKKNEMNADRPMLLELVPPDMDEEPVVGMEFTWRVPNGVDCPACGSSYPVLHLGYPHLDPTEVLSPSQARLLDHKRCWDDSMDDQEKALRDCIEHLERHFFVPVFSGTYFGPLKIALGRKMKWDIVVLSTVPVLLGRRSAVEALRREGFDFEFIELMTTGKYASTADIVQLVAPIVGHGRLPEGMTYCKKCHGRQGKPKDWAEFRSMPLFDTPEIHKYPFFSTVTCGGIYLSRSFFEATKKLGLKMDAKNLVKPTQTVSQVPSDLRRIEWPRGRGLEISGEQNKDQKPVEDKIGSEVPIRFNPDEWLQRLSRFMDLVKDRGGTVVASIGRTTRVPSNPAPHCLKEFFDACKGRLFFSYRIVANHVERSGEITMDEGMLWKLKKECERWATDTWIAEEPEEQTKWDKAIPFAALSNGDFLALDSRGAPEDRLPVLYLNHEDTSEILSPSFEQFLLDWEMVLYQGPEMRVLSEYQRGKEGWLTGESPLGLGTLHLAFVLGIVLQND